MRRPPDSNSFIVRIWRERSEVDNGCSTWRGWVQHTRSGESVYVQDVQDMLVFMEQWSGDLDDRREAPPRLK